jgi:putative spermidine/putrescine transport system permease protein
VISFLLVVPTAYWAHLRLPRLRPVIEFITLMPFVVPAVVLVFGYIRIYGSRPLVLTGTPILLVAGYVVLSSHMYRSVAQGCGRSTCAPDQPLRAWEPPGPSFSQPSSPTCASPC